MNPLFATVLAIVLPLIQGALVVLIVNALKRLGTWLARQPGTIQQIVAALVAVLITLAVHAGIPITATDLGQFGTPDVQALLTWIISHVLYVGTKSDTKE